MKIKITFTTWFLWTLCSSGSIFSQESMNNYTKKADKEYISLWKEVEESEKQSLPQTSLATVNEIYRQAIAEKNSPQIIKTLLYKTKYETIIDQEKYPQLIEEIEEYTTNTEYIPEKNILNILLANLYFNYYINNQYVINLRTDREDFFPEDIREWTTKNFIEKIEDKSSLSLQNREILKQIDNSEYKSIILSANKINTNSNTLYELIINQILDLYNRMESNYTIRTILSRTFLDSNTYFDSVENFLLISIPATKYDFILRSLQLYQELLDFKMEKRNRTSLLDTDLRRLEYVLNNSQSRQEAGKEYMDALNKLIETCNNGDECASILYRKAVYYRKSYEMWEPVPDSQRPDNPYHQENVNNHIVYEILQEAISKYPAYEQINVLKNLLIDITSTYAKITGENVIYPGTEQELKMEYRNLDTLWIDIYKIEPKESESKYNGFLIQDQGNYLTSGKKLQQKKIIFDNQYPFEKKDTVLKIPIKEEGIYEYVIYFNEKKTEIINHSFYVSRLALVTRSFKEGSEVLVTDRISGKPIKGASVKVLKRTKENFEELTCYTTDKSGLALIKEDDIGNFIHVSYKNDTSLLIIPINWNPFKNQNYKISTEKLLLYTDRSLYRPGQTVYFKGIAIRSTDANSLREVIRNKEILLTLYDANYQEVTTQSFITNDFGSISGEFLIPQQVLSGNFSLSSSDNMWRTSFKVEEYKRPAFDIRIFPNTETFNFGDVVTLKGEAKTFSGISIQNTEVHYKVIRKPFRLFPGYYREDQVAQGIVNTDEMGNFVFSFPVEKHPDDIISKNIYYTFEIEATVTSTNGETQQTKSQIIVGDKSIYMQVSGLDHTVVKEKSDSIQVKAYNLMGQQVYSSGNFKLYRLKGKQKLGKEEHEVKWEIDKQITQGNFQAGTSLDISFLKKESSGKYRIIFEITDTRGREVTQEVDFLLASLNDKKPPVIGYEWLIEPGSWPQNGKPAVIVYGSSASDVYVLYDIIKDSVKISSERFKLNGRNKQIEIPYKEYYGRGIAVNFTFIKDKRLFSKRIEINKKEQDKELVLNMDVFRDKLLPGEKEEWRISVKNKNKDPVKAEILAGMYDASLDKIYSHKWYFNPNIYNYIPSTYFLGNRSLERYYDYLYSSSEYLPVQYPEIFFNWFGLFPFGQRNVLMRGSGAFSLPSLSDGLQGRIAGIDVSDKVYESSVEVDEVKVFSFDTSGVDDGQQSVQIRENFNETAFFYPRLITNEKGETLISFTVPESNTEWKFMALAHTADLYYGQLVKNVVTQKKLMVTPNLPRFLRNGDKVSIAANVSNLSEESLSGTVKFELENTHTGEQFITSTDQMREFAILPGNTTTITWEFRVPSDIDMALLRIVASTDNFSDGEQHLIPVLPNRILVTESMDLNIFNQQEKTFYFDKMTNNQSITKENYRYTVEFASNPVWYAVQALPVLTEPQNEDVVSWFAALYGNTLAGWLIQTTPELKKVISQWKLQSGKESTLISALEKNRELKNILIEETPWVKKSKNETEQKQQLILLFDENRMDNLNKTTLDKILSFQQYDGGWSWFNGMNSSVSLTNWILYGLARLQDLTGIQPDEQMKKMQSNAITYIDKKFKEDFDRYKKDAKNLNTEKMPDIPVLEYLLVRSFYQDIPFGETQEAVDFYSDLVIRNWAKTDRLYSRAIIAIWLSRTGNKEIAHQIVRSLREHASSNEEMGMFWANNRARTFIFQGAVAEHTFIMEAFEEVEASPEELDKMKLWLLKQKQSQQWESTPATVSAVYHLLKSGNDWLQEKGNTRIEVGGEPINIGSNEAGTGYYKKVFESQEINSEMAEINVKKENKGPGFGAVYWQYYENLNEIQASENGLFISKKIWVEKINDEGKILEEINENRKLKIGDKAIVRLTVRVDRDMEFVSLKDMRAGCFEPVDQLSEIKWNEKVVYYQTSRDASTNFYFYNLPKGTYVFEYPLYATRGGTYSGGIATIQNRYAPEFVSHTVGEDVIVE